MGDAIISRRGAGVLQQALAPTITEVSTTDSIITFTITNNDASTAVILYEVDDATPDENSIELAAAATSGNLTISGLSPGTFDLYATANVTGKVKSNVTEKNFTILASFIEATGGTTAEYDDGGKRYKSHTFNSGGTFTVTKVGSVANDRNQVDYLIVAGGGGGGRGEFAQYNSGGGGGGGFRYTLGTSGGNSSAESKVTVTAQAYSIDVGAGGSGGSTDLTVGGSGTNSSALGITSTGGGGGGFRTVSGLSGGSGGGGGSAGGAGTTDEGFAGGSGASNNGGSGGGAGGAGLNQTIGTDLDNRGPGLPANIINNSSVDYSFGGLPNNQINGDAGTDSTPANSGNGGSGAATSGSNPGASGIVVIRYEIAPSV